MSDTADLALDEERLWPSGGDESRRSVRLSPRVVFWTGVVCAIAAAALGSFVYQRIVYVGPVDAARIDGALWLVATLLVGTSIVLGLQEVRAGPRATFVIVLTQVIIAFGSILVAIVVNGIVLIVLLEEPAHRLDTPGSSSQYILSTFTFGETTATLWKGNGVVYERVDRQMPSVAREVDFADPRHVETEADGSTYLVYPAAGGGEARVLLP